MDAVIKKIVVPVDFSERSAVAARYGCGLARSLGARVYLIHVAEQSLARSVDTQRHDGAAMARRRLTTFAQQLDATVPLTTEVRTGPIAESITSAAKAYGADLVVMATHGRTGLSHLIHGSVAEEVIRTVCAPVLVLRESGSIRMHRMSAAA